MSTDMSPAEHPRAASIESGTGTALATWVDRIEQAGGRDLDHTAIARLLPERWDITEWWAQGVTVTYEQLIGRRVVGQSCEGDFAASASRTLVGDPDAVRARWDAYMTPARRARLGLEEPSLTDTATWRYWRAAVEDGTRLSVNITAKAAAKGSATRSPGAGSSRNPRSTLSIEHKGLGSAADRDAWKAAWTRTLDDFTALTGPDSTVPINTAPGKENR
ncbi:hypothetical protein [Brachybacterium sp. FME24]|uniref:hypothetical protein n=1 Tax=Brachybacterium sp. FME24 TaxID=2742605 RepID=UPI001865E543|nr:hypothetical protein [Brachybacterium sp. FME24]